MKIIGTMLARNEDWIVGMSARAALTWCDELVVFLRGSDDYTWHILDDLKRIALYDNHPSDDWDEMDDRQQTLEIARKLGGTHIAIIDADEVLTHNLIPQIRGWFGNLKPGQILDLPMVPVWRGLDKYRHDSSVWSRSQLTLGYADEPGLTHKPREGYHHHNRPPHGCRPDRNTVDCDGGVMHLQWAAWQRVLFKHRWYKLMEVTRYKGREPAKFVDKKYSAAINEDGIAFAEVPAHWWGDYRRDLVKLDHEPWFKGECERLWKEHGPKAFKDLNLWDWPTKETAHV